MVSALNNNDDLRGERSIVLCLRVISSEYVGLYSEAFPVLVSRGGIWGSFVWLSPRGSVLSSSMNRIDFTGAPCPRHPRARIRR